MDKGKVVSIEDRIPKLKQQRRKRANKRLIFLLLLFFSLIVCVVYFQSPLSHVKAIKVSGNRIYTEEELIKITGLTKDTNMWNINQEEITSKLKKLPELKDVKIDIQLPNTINIHTEEWQRMAYIAKEAKFQPVLGNGEILEKTVSELPVNAPILVGFTKGDVIREMITGLESIPEEVLNSISEIHYSPKDTDKYHITLFMNDGFEVSASLRSFSEKMPHYPSIVSQLDPSKKGIIDLEVGSFFKAYETEGEEGLENENESEG
ncbi:FtsQ-type POTRA domain-containing protein [Bacillus sp. 31A1R]|uniref:Cell division protein DivIB n=1 Tax=Robertmurraya mangrovi TaxID=3098077 RepID=A0ABU5IU90_9BACI|nr:FtsQ-type POTRA domain-containing protein [Bacillus sp. 31A1R]MDZ5470704.1 FtsQ-type POTRA domain-containing protein [Bacillus sp. 31A1R]